jgi:hypothetical protein
MRAPRCSLPFRFGGASSALALHLVGVGACLVFPPACDTNKYDDPKFMAAPKSYDPKGADLSFNEKSLEAFNSMSSDERAAHLEKLKATKGSLKGQARFQRDEELTEKIDDRKYGQFVVWATVPEPVWLEVQVEYQLFSGAKLLTGVAPNTHIEFSGTLVDLIYQDSAKPRRLEIKLQADAIAPVKD